MTNETLAAQWRERFDDYARSGLSVERWCVAHDLSEYRFYYWRRKLSNRAASARQSGVDWLALPIDKSPRPESSLTVRVGAASIDVAPGFDPALLRAVALALEPARC
jgi:transposase-like protein